MASSASGAFSQRLQKRFQAWVSRRIPPSRSVVLDQKRLFIFPTRAGFFFGASLLAMLIAGINYENNLVFGLTFLLATLFVVSILHTFANLSGLAVHAIGADHGFPGQQVEFRIQLERLRQRPHIAVHTHWQDSTKAWSNLDTENVAKVVLHVPVKRRGWYRPGRLLLESTFPLGLIRCWTWLDLDIAALVYPRPVPCEAPMGAASERPDGDAVAVDGNDDFTGFRDYRRGDSPRHLHWKGLAKGQALQAKIYSAYANRSEWLDWEQFPEVGVEQRLSFLCYWVLALHGEGIDYGLRLPGTVLEPDSGEAHRDAALKALALYGLAEEGA